jgi:hypothetical protein
MARPIAIEVWDEQTASLEQRVEAMVTAVEQMAEFATQVFQRIDRGYQEIQVMQAEVKRLHIENCHILDILENRDSNC